MSTYRPPEETGVLVVEYGHISLHLGWHGAMLRCACFLQVVYSSVEVGTAHREGGTKVDTSGHRVKSF
eukprot:SAG31_NODE_1573_length_7850_cov_1.757193_12_plen_67_part_01